MALSPCGAKIDSQGRELISHGTASFPVACYYDDLSREEVPWHWHEEMEILSVKKGRGLVTVDMVPYEVGMGDAVAVFPGQLHGISQTGGEAMEYENIIFRPSMLMAADQDVCTAEFLLPLAEGRIKSPVHMKAGMEDYASLSECIRRLDTLCRDKPYGYQLGVKGELFSLLCLLAAKSLPIHGERPSKSREKMKLLLGYIEEHYGERITVEDGAALCFYSNSHFMKFFKRYMGMPFTQYLNDFRLEKAAGLLRTTLLPVTDVAQQCGFDNISYFNRLFRKKYHGTPGAYRKDWEMD